MILCAGRLSFLAPDMFDNFTGPQAGSANLDSFRFTIDQGMNPLQVGHPTSSGSVVGVRDIVAELGFLAAYFTNFGHLLFISFQKSPVIYTYFRKRQGISEVVNATVA